MQKGQGKVRGLRAEDKYGGAIFRIPWMHKVIALDVKSVDMDVNMAVYCGWFDNGAAGAFCAGDAGKYGYIMDMDAKGEKTDG